MSIKSSRRDWLKLSALSAAALAFSSFDSTSEAHAQTSSNKIIKLSGNENPYGFSPKAKNAFLDSLNSGNRYVDLAATAQLEKKIAEREGVKPENVVIGTGSGEVLCMAAIAFGRKEIVAPEPTFPALMRYAENFGAKVKSIPLNEKYEHDFPSMIKSVSPDTSLVYVCNPNNPTASVSPNDDLRKFCREAAKNVPVFVDEAYLEYTDEFPRNSMIDLVKNNENIIISRTFSKIYGMAGLRVGYGLAKAEIARQLKKFKMTWFNNPSIHVALAAYDDHEFIADSKRKNVEVRRAFLTEMDKMNLRYAPTVANFVWLNVGANRNDLGSKMQSRNILVGNPQNDWLRVTIGTSEEMQAFVSALKTI